MMLCQTRTPHRSKPCGQCLTKSMIQADSHVRPLQVIGDLVVPELPALDRDTYIRQVSGTVGLSALAATVVRVAPALLFGLCSAEADKPEPILGDLGQLERHILWQLALAENWKRDQEVAKEAAKGMAGVYLGLMTSLPEM